MCERGKDKVDAKTPLTVQPGVGYIPHCVLDRPDDAVHEQLELGRGDGEQG
jgi:hypothetical protein